MAQFAAPEKYRQDHTIFVVGQDGQGHWCVQENHGLVEGSFISRADAIRFAQDERAFFPGALVVVTPEQVRPHFHRAAS